MLGFFDTVIRYSIKSKQWNLLTKQPSNCKKSKFFSEGRISTSAVLIPNELFIVFGGSSIAKENNDFLILPVDHLKEANNFSEIQTIM